jgi:tetratricopeptide (TPR) repeat protein
MPLSMSRQPEPRALCVAGSRLGVRGGPVRGAAACARAGGAGAVRAALALLVGLTGLGGLGGPAAAQGQAGIGGTPAVFAALATPQQVTAPHYGDVLFHFYQEHHFDALSAILVSSHFGRLQPQNDEAELLRGGLLLSYGLHQEAGEIFTRLIERGAPPAVRDRAWYHLARIRYQRGLHAQARDALGRIGEALPAELRTEAALIGAQIDMAAGDYAAAAKRLEGITRGDGAGLVARYNLGVALIRQGQAERGNAVLEAIGKAAAPDEETQALRDKANLALGYAELQAGRPVRARSHFERVRLQGMYTNKALLGFGWASAALQQYTDALVPWNELVLRDASDAAVLEGHLAVPYALAELGARGQAAQLYREALALYEREGEALEQSITMIRDGGLVDGLLARNPGEDMGWFVSIRELPELPHGSHLAPVLARHDFQEAFKNVRDLRILSRTLAQWQERLAVYDDMLANRRSAFAERLPRVLAASGAGALAPLQARRDELAATLAAAEAGPEVEALASPRERDQLARVAAVRRGLEGAGPAAGGDLAQATERLRRVAGALTWQLAQAWPQRLWQTKKALKDTDAELDAARGHIAALEAAQSSEPQRFDAFAERLKALQARLALLQPVITALHDEQRVALQDIAVAELKAQQLRLGDYTAQARFALAQLLDRAVAEPGGQRAP